MRDSAFAFLRATYWRWARRSSRSAPISPMRRRCWRSATPSGKFRHLDATRKAASSGASTITTRPPRCPTSSIWCGWRPARRWRRRRARCRSRRSARISWKVTSTASKRRKPSCSTASICGCAQRFVVGEAERAKFWQKIENQYHALMAKKKARAAAGALAQAVRRGAAGTFDHSRLLAAHGRHRQPRPAALARLRHLARRPAAARGQGAGAVRLDARARRRRRGRASTTSRAANTARPTHGTRRAEIC